MHKNGAADNHEKIVFTGVRKKIIRQFSTMTEDILHIRGKRPRYFKQACRRKSQK